MGSLNFRTKAFTEEPISHSGRWDLPGAVGTLRSLNIKVNLQILTAKQKNSFCKKSCKHPSVPNYNFFQPWPKLPIFSLGLIFQQSQTAPASPRGSASPCRDLQPLRHENMELLVPGSAVHPNEDIPHGGSASFRDGSLPRKRGAPPPHRL